jgi:transposase
MSNEIQLKRPKYTLEFKQDAVKLVLEKGYTQQQAADSLGVSLSAMGRWVRAEQGSACLSTAKQSVLKLADQEELVRLRKENERLRMEREILKNRLPGSPTPYAKKQVVPYTHLTRGHWPTAFWRLNPRQKTWPMGSCGPNCGGTSSDPV